MTNLFSMGYHADIGAMMIILDKFNRALKIIFDIITFFRS